MITLLSMDDQEKPTAIHTATYSMSIYVIAPVPLRENATIA
jgi:hypothetical protein